MVASDIFEVAGPVVCFNGIFHYPVEHQVPLCLDLGHIKGHIAGENLVEEFHREDHIGSVWIFYLAGAHIQPEREWRSFFATLFDISHKQLGDMLCNRQVLLLSAVFGIIHICNAHHCGLVRLQQFVHIDSVRVVVVLGADHSRPGPVVGRGEHQHPVQQVLNWHQSPYVACVRIIITEQFHRKICVAALVVGIQVAAPDAVLGQQFGKDHTRYLVRSGHKIAGEQAFFGFHQRTVHQEVHGPDHEAVIVQPRLHPAVFYSKIVIENAMLKI